MHLIQTSDTAAYSPARNQCFSP